MRVKLTAKEAQRLMDKYGISYGADGVTFYAQDLDCWNVNDYGFGNELTPAIFEFNTKAERDKFVQEQF